MNMFEMAEKQTIPTTSPQGGLPPLVESFVSFLWMLWNEIAGNEGQLVL